MDLSSRAKSIETVYREDYPEASNMLSWEIMMSRLPLEGGRKQ